MSFFRRIGVCLSVSVLAASVVQAGAPRDLGGFVLGGTMEAAQRHAAEQEWTLKPLSDNLPGRWIVEGEALTLFVCEGTVTSVARELEGDLEEFAALVFSMQLELGEPDIQITSVPSGVGSIATIDARFETDDGAASVVLQSLGGERTFAVNHWIASACH